MKLTFVRHSKTEFRPEIPIVAWGLTEEGIGLAKDLANDERIKCIDILYSSIETKALETSIYLAKPNGIKIIPNDKLVEVTSITNKIFPDFDTYARDYFEGRVERWNGGESVIEALKRFNNALYEIVEAEKLKGSKNIGILSHGSIYALFTRDYCDKPIWELHKSIKMPDIAEYDWDNKQFISLWNSWSSNK